MTNKVLGAISIAAWLVVATGWVKHSAQGSVTDQTSVLAAQQSMARGAGVSTYFAWRNPSQQTWLVITSYEGTDARHDTATIVRPDRDHDICLDYPTNPDFPRDALPERVCKSTAEVAKFKQIPVFGKK